MNAELETKIEQANVKVKVTYFLLAAALTVFIGALFWVESKMKVFAFDEKSMTLQYDGKTYYLFEKLEVDSSAKSTPLGIICGEGKRARYYYDVTSANAPKPPLELCVSQEEIERFETKVKWPVRTEKVVDVTSATYQNCLIDATTKAAIKTAESYATMQKIYEDLKKRNVGGELAAKVYEAWPRSEYLPDYSKCQ